MVHEGGRPRSAADVLADWREAERRIEDAPPGSPAWHRARLEATALADEYRTLIGELAHEAHDLGANPSIASSKPPAEPLPVHPTISGGS